MINEMDPIIVTGLPRSGTSLVTGILAICGAWAGNTPAPDPHNRKGTFENVAIRENLIKPYLLMHMADPLGLDPLPTVATDPLIDPCKWREMVNKTIQRQGYDDGPWVLKDAKIALMWRMWADAFPAAKWVLVRREASMAIASCMRAEPMTRRMGHDYQKWAKWADLYRKHLVSITVPASHIWPDRDVFGDMSGVQSLVGKLGLTWRPDIVSAFVDDRLFHKEKR